MDTSKKIFVTGSTGFIGSVLVDKLLERGFFVRASKRNVPAVPQKNVEYIVGDIMDKDSIRTGMTGCNYVFHLAAYAKNWAKNPQVFSQINIEGTRNVFAVAKELGIEKIVWTSTIVTFGCTPPGIIGNEEMPRTNVYFTEYERTKTAMEQESAEWIKNGLPLVIVNPTRVFGPGVMSESNSVTMLIDLYRRGRFPILLNWGRNIGNYGFVDDVAEGHLLAMEQGKIGERYILGGENVSLKNLFQMIDSVDGKKRFQLKIYRIIPMLVASCLELRAKWFGIYPPITPDWLRTFLADWAFSCGKAEKELNYKITPFEEAIHKTCQWLNHR